MPNNTKKTMLDAWNGYHSIRLREENRHMTTFLVCNKCVCSALYSVLLSEFRELGRSCPPGHNLKGFSSLKVESVYAIYNHYAIECSKWLRFEFGCSLFKGHCIFIVFPGHLHRYLKNYKYRMINH